MINPRFIWIALPMLATACVQLPTEDAPPPTMPKIPSAPAPTAAPEPATPPPALAKTAPHPEPAAVAAPTPPEPDSGPLVEDTCVRIAEKLASIGYEECLGLDLRESGHHSVHGTPILEREFPPLPSRQPLGRVLLIGGVHGDELSSVSVVFKWLRKLEDHHSGLFHWIVAPMANPDGTLLKRAQRINANGIDLNRNLPTPNWLADSRDYWKRTKRDPRRYPGARPASEPETRWLMDEIEHFQPDVIVSVHSPHHLVDYDAPTRRQAPQKIGMLQRNFLGTYPGSLGNYAGLQRGIPVVTLELPHSWYLPEPAEITHMWVDLVRWLRTNVPNARQQRLAKFGANAGK